MTITRTASLLGLVGLLAAGCGGGGDEAHTTLQGAAGTSVTGKATFTQVADGVHVVVELEHASPGTHGIHVHEKGDCSAADFSSAGGHFTPVQAEHGGPAQPPRHAGDLGNIEVGEGGSGKLDGTFAGLTVADGPNSVVGRALVLHADPDDLKTQPSGNSGSRIACGVIER